jgi:dTDP-4-amino-4,6-dideoxygalactose transaminase
MHATKLFNSFEGGIITTNDDSLAELLLSMRNFGITGQDTVSHWGSNYKLSEVHAAFAMRQLQSIDDLVEIYKRNAQSYANSIRKIGLRCIRFWNEDYLAHPGCTHSYVCLEIQNSSVVSRDEIVSYLRENNIYAKRYFFPGVHKCQPYNSDSVTLPTTEKLCQQVLVLPTGSQVNEQDIERIVSLIKQAGDLKQLTKEPRITTPAISTDFSHLADKRRYLELQKAKYLKLVDECAKDIDFVEEQLKMSLSDAHSDSSPKQGRM